MEYISLLLLFAYATYLQASRGKALRKVEDLEKDLAKTLAFLENISKAYDQEIQRVRKVVNADGELIGYKSFAVRVNANDFPSEKERKRRLKYLLMKHIEGRIVFNNANVLGENACFASITLYAPGDTDIEYLCKEIEAGHDV